MAKSLSVVLEKRVTLPTVAKGLFVAILLGTVGQIYTF